MARSCSVCSSPSAEVASARLLRGTSVRDVAAMYGFSKSAVHRHNASCLRMARVAVVKATERQAARMERRYERDLSALRAYIARQEALVTAVLTDDSGIRRELLTALAGQSIASAIA